MNYLPEKLNEISGLQWVNDSTLAAVQDENGFLFFINPSSGKIYDKIKFGKKGDYEGVALVDKTYYILKSNGTITRFHSGETKKTAFKVCKDVEFEGLCYDASSNRLLVACKLPCGKKKRNKVLVYEFDLEKSKYSNEPILNIDQEDLHKNFRTSGIAIHPNGHWFMLSSVAKMLVEIKPNGKLLNANPLNPFIFHQPEGITFSPGGILYISNEKGETGPSIMTFE